MPIFRGGRLCRLTQERSKSLTMAFTPLNALNAFVAVARRLSYAAAAKDLGVSTSALSGDSTKKQYRLSGATPTMDLQKTSSRPHLTLLVLLHLAALSGCADEAPPAAAPPDGLVSAVRQEGVPLYDDF